MINIVKKDDCNLIPYLKNIARSKARIIVNKTSTIDIYFFHFFFNVKNHVFFSLYFIVFRSSLNSPYLF